MTYTVRFTVHGRDTDRVTERDFSDLYEARKLYNLFAMNVGPRNTLEWIEA